MNIKLHWGWTLFGIYVLFMLAMLGMVFASRKHDINLVSKDYYQRGVDYESEIYAAENYKALPNKVGLRYDGRTLTIRIPEEASAGAKGTVVLFRPSDHHLDRNFSLQLDSARAMVIPVEGLAPGLWRVKIHWEAGGKAYRFEDVVHI